MKNIINIYLYFVNQGAAKYSSRVKSSHSICLFIIDSYFAIVTYLSSVTATLWLANPKILSGLLQQIFVDFCSICITIRHSWSINPKLLVVLTFQFFWLTITAAGYGIGLIVLDTIPLEYLIKKGQLST